MQTKSGLTAAIQNELLRLAINNSPADNAALVQMVAAELCKKMTKPEMQKFLYQLQQGRQGTQ